jgi:hypothetical protein
MENSPNAGVAMAIIAMKATENVIKCFIGVEERRYEDELGGKKGSGL